MAKPSLIVYNAPYQQESLFHSTWFTNLVSQHFNTQPWSGSVVYPDHQVFVVGCNHWKHEKVRELFRGRRVIVDALWESRTSKWGALGNTVEPQQIMFYGNLANGHDARFRFVPNWFWYNESLWFQARRYHKYRPNPNFAHKFLMPIGHYRDWRGRVIDAVQPYLQDCYWSCVEQGQTLPGTIKQKRLDHRLFLSNWYDDTHFSLVCESARTMDTAIQFLTEKIYKPVAFYHPFMVVGASGLLDMLRNQGFVTFDNIFDESYDTQQDFETKLKIICNNIENFAWGQRDQETWNRLRHNHARFYDFDVIEQGLVRDVVEPMLEYIERS